MRSEQTNYSAITAKVCAMYGHRLTEADWVRLDACRSVSEIRTYLQNCAGWRESVSSLPTDGLVRGELEAALRGHLIREFIKLYKFASLENRRILLFFVHRFEYESILERLRRLISPASAHTAREYPPFLTEKSKMDFTALMAANSWGDILHAVKDSVYYKWLVSIQSAAERGLPDYTAVSVALQGAYFSAMHQLVQKRFHGEMRRLFLLAQGEEADLLNLVHIMRLKRYFPNSPQRLQDVLFPVHYRLNHAFFETVMNAPDYESALDLLADTRYGEFFKSHHFQYVDDYYRRMLYELNRRHLSAGRPSPYIASAYLFLKEHEMRRLFGTIERVHYGLTESDANT